MINKLIITEGNETPKQIQLTEYDTFPYRYKFSTPGTKKVQFALDETDEICSEAFKGCETLTKVTFPSQITKIKTEAFNGCKKLNNLIIPSTIKFVGDNAFGNCDSLTSITFEDSIPPQWVTPIENTKTFIYIPSESKFVKTEKNEEENKQYYTKEIWNAFTEVPAGKKISEITEDLYECNWLSVHEDPSCIIEEKNRILPQTIELESTNYVFREITPGDKKEIKFFIESPAGNLTNKKVFILQKNETSAYKILTPEIDLQYNPVTKCYEGVCLIECISMIMNSVIRFILDGNTYIFNETSIQISLADLPDCPTPELFKNGQKVTSANCYFIADDTFTFKLNEENTDVKAEEVDVKITVTYSNNKSEELTGDFNTLENEIDKLITENAVSITIAASKYQKDTKTFTCKLVHNKLTDIEDNINLIEKLDLNGNNVIFSSSSLNNDASIKYEYKFDKEEKFDKATNGQFEVPSRIVAKMLASGKDSITVYLKASAEGFTGTEKELVISKDKFNIIENNITEDNFIINENKVTFNLTDILVEGYNVKYKLSEDSAGVVIDTDTTIDLTNQFNKEDGNNEIINIEYWIVKGGLYDSEHKVFEFTENWVITEDPEGGEQPDTDDSTDIDSSTDI